MYLKEVNMIRLLTQLLLRKTILITSRVGLESVNSIFLHWLLNTFLSASLVPNYSYIWNKDHKMWTLLLSIIIIHWNTSWKTVPILHNYPASNTMYITFRKFYENSKKIHILYISFRKVHAKWTEGKILSAGTFSVGARQSLAGWLAVPNQC